MTSDRSAASSVRRSFIMLAVLVCMMSAMLVATGLLFVSQTEAAGAAGSGDTAQSRALLWSGAQAIMSRLREQRARILAGELPELEPQYVIYETTSRSGVVRLLPMTGDGNLLAAEAAKLDFNVIDAESLAATGMIDRLAADGLIAWRDALGRPVQSISELLGAPGMSIDRLYGSAHALLSIDPSRAADGRLPDGRAGASPPHGLADVLTVFAVEPALQFTAALRINLNQPWSDELGRRISERFGADAAALMQQAFESGVKFDSDAGLVKAMRAASTPLEQWPVILDAFTTEDGDLHFGRLDINAAPREALLGLPGVNAEQADQLVGVREELSPIERGGIAWPVLKGIVAPEAFERIAGRITARCWTYRVRIAAGEVSADAPDGPLSNALVQELVIDLAGPTPRIAYLRDITLLRDAALMAMEAGRAAPPVSEEVEPQVDRATATRPDRAPAASRPALPGRSTARRGDDESHDESLDASPPPEATGDSGGRRIGRWTRSD